MRPIFLALLLLSAQAHGEVLPVFNPSGPNAEAYGSAENYPTGYPTTVRTEVGNFSHYDAISPAHNVARAATPAPFDRAATEIKLSYTYKGAIHTIEDYLARQPATGLLILKDNTILAEHYQYGRTEQDRLLSHSMAKTVTSMLIGIAVSEGKIHSIDDTAETYVPSLKGSEIGGTPIRALLHMASGIAFHEVYDGNDDSAALNKALFRRTGEGAAATVQKFNTRTAPPDTVWYYKGLDTETLGLVLMAATGQPIADYLSDKIWSKIGTERDAAWGTDFHGLEPGYCCLNITLRDWGRLGRLLASDGAWNGTQIIPRQWLLDATTPSAPFLKPGASVGYYGYGYQVWLLPGARRQFVLMGVYGQMLFIDPASKLVLVHTAVRPTPTHDPDSPELNALWRALVAQEGSR
jgi:CubicO group peptidase (beta-lactamase class C family)